EEYQQLRPIHEKFKQSEDERLKQKRKLQEKDALIRCLEEQVEKIKQNCSCGVIPQCKNNNEEN
ncbi:MAG: hypothetical protein M3162_07105, partial [Thermoproteota archaeon]|nr:hypothetical protein [Thermoproteota archaeon]